MAEVVTTSGAVEYLLGDMAHIADLSWSTAWPYGCEAASWRVDLSANSSVPAALKIGSRAEVWDGPIRVWSGYVSEVEAGEPWTVHAKGYYALAAHYLALAAGPYPTSTPSTAVTQAISRGWPLSSTSGLSADPFASTDGTTALNTVFDLLNSWSAAEGVRWGVDRDRRLVVAADPTTPDLMLDNLVAIRGNADDDYVTNIYANHVAALTDGEPSAYGLGEAGIASTPELRRERGLDLTNLGLMSTASASAHAQGRIDLVGARMGYTSGVEAAYGELTREGGTPVRLGHISAGSMFRAFTVADQSGRIALGMTQDVVIGRTNYTDGASTIALSPVDMAPRDLGSILAAPPAPPDQQFRGDAA